jgi:hypothetical protein
LKTNPDGTFSIAVDARQAAAVANLLATHGLELRELLSGERSLEDVFMELTGPEIGE